MNLSQAILPVAGFGTRFLPWTKVVPKELLPIGKKPIIALLVDECLSVGIKDICFVISEGKEAIPDFFKTDATLEAELAKRGKSHLLEELSRYHEVRFTTMYQKDMRGDGDAIAKAHDWVTSDIVAILFGDDLIHGKENGLQQLVKAYGALKDAKNPALLCLQDVPKDLVGKYGIVDIEKSNDRLKKVKGLVEKPKPENAPSTFGIVGKYVIPKMIINRLKEIDEGSHGGEVRLIDALISVLGTIDIYGYACEGIRLDTGTPEGYKEAVRILG